VDPPQEGCDLFFETDYGNVLVSTTCWRREIGTWKPSREDAGIALDTVGPSGFKIQNYKLFVGMLVYFLLKV
jgi:hypothetical protein